LLDAALGAVKQAAYYQENLDVFDIAAKYMCRIIDNHCFIDGNKRTGTVLALTFLVLNGESIDFEEDDLIELACGIANHQFTDSEVAELFRAKNSSNPQRA